MIINSTCFNNNKNQDLNKSLIKMEDCKNFLYQPNQTGMILSKKKSKLNNTNTTTTTTSTTNNNDQSFETQISSLQNQQQQNFDSNKFMYPIPTCSKCHINIDDKYVFNISNTYWHEECLLCSQCGIFLNQSCFLRNGQLFCKEDYFKNFGIRCNFCFESIGANEMIMRIDAPVINQQPIGFNSSKQTNQIYYHLNCFKCLTCDKLLQKGDEYVLRNEGIYCKYDYERNFLVNSNRCNNNHVLRNSSFSSSPASSSSSSSSSISVSTLSTSSVYSNTNHLDNTLLSSSSCPNGIYSPRSNQFNKPGIIAINGTSNINHNNSNSSFTSLQSEEENSLEEDCSGRKNKNTYANKTTLVPGCQVNNNASSLIQQQAHTQARPTPRKSGNSRRITKRPRTILNASQRYDFREAFKQSQKPCRKVREHLASKTGLSVRVVQVWFQNERAKVKKLQRRQQQPQQQNQFGQMNRLDKSDGFKQIQYGNQNGKGLNKKFKNGKSKKSKKSRKSNDENGNEDGNEDDNEDGDSNLDSDDDSCDDDDDIDDEDDDVELEDEDDDDDMDDDDEDENDENNIDDDIIMNNANNNDKDLGIIDDFNKIKQLNSSNSTDNNNSYSTMINYNSNNNNKQQGQSMNMIYSQNLNQSSNQYTSPSHIVPLQQSIQNLDTLIIEQQLQLQQQHHHHHHHHQNPIESLYSMQNAYFATNTS